MLIDGFILGGGEKAKASHVSRNKMLPRDRITNLLDLKYDISVSYFIYQ